jgi:quercetin dioxygenase-like cupin family protein
MKIIRLDLVPKIKLEMNGANGVRKQVAISREDGTPSFCFRVFSLEPGGYTPFHAHAFEHLNYVIEGKGALVDENNQEHPVRKGDFAFLPPNEKHQFKNKSETEEMVFICSVPNEYQ